MKVREIVGPLVVMTVILTAVGNSSCSRKPNLVITHLEATGPKIENGKGEWELPIQLTIRNKGNASAARFGLVMECLSSTSRWQTPFLFSGISYGKDSQYASFALFSGHEITVHGKVTLPHKSLGSAALKARITCCSERECGEAHLEESYVDDNESLPILVSLP